MVFAPFTAKPEGDQDATTDRTRILAIMTLATNPYVHHSFSITSIVSDRTRRSIAYVIRSLLSISPVTQSSSIFLVNGITLLSHERLMIDLDRYSIHYLYEVLVLNIDDGKARSALAHRAPAS